MANSSAKSNPCFELCQPCPTAKYQVFIFPAAGNPGLFYRQWAKHFPNCELATVIYPGRSKRSTEQLLTTVEEHVADLRKGLVPHITKPCIFIGHSVGTLLNFALAKHMIDNRERGHLIKLIIAMGRGPPHLQDLEKSLARMTKEEIVEELKRTADPNMREVFDCQPFVEMLIPILTADGKVGEQVVVRRPLPVPIVVYVGQKEEYITEFVLDEWKELTTHKDLFQVRTFDGHHNFPSECQQMVLGALKEDFDRVLGRQDT